jgi:hypothetical protein
MDFFQLTPGIKIRRINFHSNILLSHIYHLFQHIISDKKVSCYSPLIRMVIEDIFLSSTYGLGRIDNTSTSSEAIAL